MAYGRLCLAFLRCVGRPKSVTEEAINFCPGLIHILNKRSPLWSLSLAQAGLSPSHPCALLHPTELLKTQSAPEIKAGEKVFLLYCNANSSKKKHTKIPDPSLPPVKPVQAGEGHKMLSSQKTSLCQAQIQVVLKLSGLGGRTY